jgi:hypothetical protein
MVGLHFYLLRFIQFPKIALFPSGTVFAYGVTSSGKTHTMHVSLCIIGMHVPSAPLISPTCLAVCFYVHVSSGEGIALMFSMQLLSSFLSYVYFLSWHAWITLTSMCKQFLSETILNSLSRYMWTTLIAGRAKVAWNYPIGSEGCVQHYSRCKFFIFYFL